MCPRRSAEIRTLESRITPPSLAGSTARGALESLPHLPQSRRQGWERFLFLARALLRSRYTPTGNDGLAPQRAERPRPCSITTSAPARTSSSSERNSPAAWSSETRITCFVGISVIIALLSNDDLVPRNQTHSGGVQRTPRCSRTCSRGSPSRSRGPGSTWAGGVRLRSLN